MLYIILITILSLNHLQSSIIIDDKRPKVSAREASDACRKHIHGWNAKCQRSLDELMLNPSQMKIAIDYLTPSSPWFDPGNGGGIHTWQMMFDAAFGKITARQTTLTDDHDVATASGGAAAAAAAAIRGDAAADATLHVPVHIVERPYLPGDNSDKWWKDRRKARGLQGGGDWNLATLYLLEYQ